MEPRLTGIDRDEALGYLGYRGGPVPEQLRGQISQCEELLCKTARPRAVWRLFERMPDGALAGTDFHPEGEDIMALLRDCRRVILLGATLGAEVDALLRRVQVEDMARAVILDACAGAAIENVCDNLCADLAADLAPGYLTDRFSPGYGDMPLAQQAELCRVLDVGRRIGVSLSPGGLLIPQKTVTALIGVADGPQSRRAGGCAHCERYESCVIRKEGGSCGAR